MFSMLLPVRSPGPDGGPGVGRMRVAVVRGAGACCLTRTFFRARASAISTGSSLFNEGVNKPPLIASTQLQNKSPRQASSTQRGLIPTKQGSPPAAFPLLTETPHRNIGPVIVLLLTGLIAECSHAARRYLILRIAIGPATIREAHFADR